VEGETNLRERFVFFRLTGKLTSKNVVQPCTRAGKVSDASLHQTEKIFMTPKNSNTYFVCFSFFTLLFCVFVDYRGIGYYNDGKWNNDKRFNAKIL